MFFGKNSASESNESLLSNCRAQPVLFKNSTSESNESLLSNCRAQPVLFKNFASESNENPLSYCRAQPVFFKIMIGSYLNPQTTKAKDPKLSLSHTSSLSHTARCVFPFRNGPLFLISPADMRRMELQVPAGSHCCSAQLLR